MASESDIQQHILIEAMNYNCRLMRNNSGALKDTTGRLVRYGLGNDSAVRNSQIKSSDLIGFTIIHGVAVFTAIEVKRSDWKYSDNDQRSRAQNAFITWVKTCGGIAGFCASVDDFKALMERHV